MASKNRPNGSVLHQPFISPLSPPHLEAGTPERDWINTELTTSARKSIMAKISEHQFLLFLVLLSILEISTRDKVLLFFLFFFSSSIFSVSSSVFFCFFLCFFIFIFIFIFIIIIIIIIPSGVPKGWDVFMHPIQIYLPGFKPF